MIAPPNHDGARQAWRSAMTNLRRAPLLAAPAIGALLLAAGCGSSSPHSSAPPAAPPSSSAPSAAPGMSPSTTAPSSPAASGTALKVGTTMFPTALTDAAGKSVYLFAADTGSSSTCTGACASAWPPVTTSGAPSINGADMGKLGTTMRSDGTKQVTYNGHPLYYFAQDTKPGDTHGQGLKAFGAEWYLIGTDGSKIDNS
jgi:predicted lipoprotein with Yx(FWY)xxD motif